MSETATAPQRAPEEIRSVPVRHWGRWVGAAAVLLLAAWVVKAAIDSNVLQWDVISRYLFNQTVLEGLANTLFISVLAMAIGIVLGVVFAVMRLSDNPVLSAVARFYIWFFRGSPLLVQLIFWYTAVPRVFENFTIAVPFTSITLFSTPMVNFMTPLVAALFGLGLNEGAYMAEIVRGGFLAVDEGQVEAAQALGMPRSKITRRIVLPQAMRVIIPPTGNEFISMLKNSSLASVILYGELLRRVQDIYSTNLQTMNLLVVATIWYLAATSVATFFQARIERRFARGSSRQFEQATLLARLRRNLAPGRVKGPDDGQGGTGA